MKPQSLSSFVVILLATTAFLVVPCTSQGQTTYYWDSDGATAGFGNTTGTWGTSAFWSTNAAGTSATANSAITTADTVNFGTATLNYTNGTVTGPATAQGFLNMNFGAGQTTALTLSGGTLDLAASSTITQNSGSLMTISSVLQGSGSSLTKLGTGTLRLSGSNTYTGGTVLSNGILEVFHNSALGTGTLTIANPSANGRVNINGGQTITNNVVMNTVRPGPAGALQHTGTGLATLSGNIAINADAINGGAFFGGNSAANALVLSGNITKGGTATFFRQRGGFVTYSGGTGSVSGFTSIDIFGTATLGANDVFAATTRVDLGTGDRGIFNLAGFNQTVAGLQFNPAGGGDVTTGSGTLTLNGNILSFSNAASHTISGNLNLGGTNRTFDIGVGVAAVDLSISAAISNGGIVKTGSGALALSGNITYAGGTAINAGRFEIASGNNNTLTGAITGGASGTFVKSGAGTLTINSTPGANSFSGAVIVDGGTLANSANAAGFFGASSFTINNGGTMTVGSSGITFGAAGAMIINAGGTLSTSSGGFQNLGSVTLNGGTIDCSNGFLGNSFTLTTNVVVGGSSVSTIQGSQGLALSANIGSTNVTRIFDVANATGDTNADLIVSIEMRDAHSSGTAASLQKSGLGTMRLSGSNTYTGTTTVAAGTLELATNGSLRFVIGGSGTNNAILGSGTTVLDGSFVFDLAAASTNAGATWTIVANTLSNTYGSNFLVSGGFSGVSGGSWTNTSTNGATYVFSQPTGVLSVQTVSTNNYASWVSYWTNAVPGGFTNTAGTADPDGDTFNNDMEFAFDGNPTVGSPALLAASRVGTNAVFNYVARKNPPGGVTYQVQSTTNLTTGWTNAAVTVSNSANTNSINIPADYERKEFTVPSTGSLFYRVQATIAP